MFSCSYPRLTEHVLLGIQPSFPCSCFASFQSPSPPMIAPNLSPHHPMHTDDLTVFLSQSTMGCFFLFLLLHLRPINFFKILSLSHYLFLECQQTAHLLSTPISPASLSFSPVFTSSSSSPCLPFLPGFSCRPCSRYHHMPSDWSPPTASHSG